MQNKGDERGFVLYTSVYHACFSISSEILLEGENDSILQQQKRLVYRVGANTQSKWKKAIYLDVQQEQDHEHGKSHKKTKDRFYSIWQYPQSSCSGHYSHRMKRHVSRHCNRVDHGTRTSPRTSMPLYEWSFCRKKATICSSAWKSISRVTWSSDNVYVRRAN